MASQTAEESLGEIRTVRAFNMEYRETTAYSEAITGSFAVGFQQAVAYGLFAGVIGASSYGAIVLVLWYVDRAMATLHGCMASSHDYLVYVLTGQVWRQASRGRCTAVRHTGRVHTAHCVHRSSCRGHVRCALAVAGAAYRQRGLITLTPDPDRAVRKLDDSTGSQHSHLSAYRQKPCYARRCCERGHEPCWQ